MSSRIKTPARSLTTSILTILLLGMSMLLAGPANATTGDWSPPTVVSTTITPASADVSAGPTTVSVRLRITDPSGVQTPMISVLHKPTGQSHAGYADLVSGTNIDGEWEYNAVIPKNAAAGTWSVEAKQILQDLLGNESFTVGPGNELGQFNITSPAQDIAPPKVESTSIVPFDTFGEKAEVVDVSDGMVELEINVRITDTTETLEPWNLKAIHKPSGQYYITSVPSLNSGTTRDGVWTFWLSLPQYAAAGTWTLQRIDLEDSLGNSTNESSDDTSVRTDFATFTVLSRNQDIALPVVERTEITPATIDVSKGPATVTIRTKITDATGSVGSDIYLRHKLSGQLEFGRSTLVSGTTTDGIWETKVTIPQSAASGTWTAQVVYLADDAGNFARNVDIGIINVISPNADMDPPVLESLTFTPDPVDVSESGALVRIRLHVTDRTGMDGFFLYARNTINRSYFIGGQAGLISGTPQDGIWGFNVYVPQDAVGAYSVEISPLTDTWGNTGSTEPMVNIGSFATGAAVLATPVPAQFTNSSGSSLGSYTIPAVTGVQYSVNGQVKAPGKYTGTGTIKVIAEPTSGYKFASTTVSEWTYTFTPLTLVSATPTITGTTKVGNALTANPGTWTTGTTLKYQWYRAGVAITGATTSNYALTTTDAGKAITVKVTGSKTGYTTVAKTSAPTALIASQVLTLTSATPTITGTTKVGYTLTANPGTWTTGTAFAYQWYRSGAAITGATASTYKLAGADAGKTITVKVTGTKTGYTTVTKTSVATAAVSYGTLTSATPTITGTKKVGYTLTANPGTWTSGATLRYQWYRAGVAITGATASTYKLAGADAGKTITVKVTGSKLGYVTIAKTSAATTLIAKGTLVSVTPTITGTKKVGYTLTANTGTWTTGTTFTYQWYRSGVAITGATAKTYKPTGYDVGKALTVKVTGSQLGYTSVAKTSAATALIARGTLTSATPTITGTKKVGYTLTANTGTWTYGTTFKYQWYRSGVAITGATAKTYKLTSYDVAKSLTVKVTGSKFGYTTVAKTSAATALIVKGTLVSPTPTITGTKTVGYTLTANPGTWTTGTTLTYRWYRSGVAITGATAKTYKLTSLDRGKTMTVRVTGTKAGYVTVSKYSAATVKIV